MTVVERYQRWLADEQAAGASFTPEQRQWLDALQDHIASNSEDFGELPCN